MRKTRVVESRICRGGGGFGGGSERFFELGGEGDFGCWMERVRVLISPGGEIGTTARARPLRLLRRVSLLDDLRFDHDVDRLLQEG